MFYLIIAILLISYYIFMAPKSVRSTITVIGMVGVIVLLLVLAVISFTKILELPTEVFLLIAMAALGALAFRDVCRLPAKAGKKASNKSYTRRTHSRHQ